MFDSPDVSLVRQERWDALSSEERRGFVPADAPYQAIGAQLGRLQIDLLEIWQG